MKILSIFSNGNEIALHNNLLGHETIYYNGDQVSKKFSVFGAVHHFDVQEQNEMVAYVISVGYNSLGGISANVWRNGEPILITLKATYENSRPDKQSSIAISGGSYHRDLV